MVLAPTFAEYEAALRLADCDVVYHLLSESNGFHIDGNRLLSDIKEQPELDMVFICNPNNPTGIPTSSELIMKIADQSEESDTLLVVDECFCEFLDNEQDYSVIGRQPSSTVVLKAFTKLYAMAGIRLGYMICSNDSINQSVMGTLQPWSVSTVAMKGGVAALKEHEYVRETKRMIKINREYLKLELKTLDPLIKVFDSSANYILFKAADLSLAQKLKEEKILIRSCGNYIGLDKSYFRIAVKSAEDNRTLISCLKELHRRC